LLKPHYPYPGSVHCNGAHPKECGLSDDAVEEFLGVMLQIDKEIANYDDYSYIYIYVYLNGVPTHCPPTTEPLQMEHIVQ
jgi:hypothetical protein